MCGAGRGPNGEPVLLLGLDQGNVNKLMAGIPLMVPETELLVGVTVVLLGDKDDDGLMGRFGSLSATAVVDPRHRPRQR